jgi:hypothetical protein
MFAPKKKKSMKAIARPIWFAGCLRLAAWKPIPGENEVLIKVYAVSINDRIGRG